MRMKINNPLSNQKDGKNNLRPTIGSTTFRSPPTIDSTKSCPLLGSKEVLPTSNLITSMIAKEIIQLVIIELVTGKDPILKASSAVKFTPPAPAPKSEEANRKGKTF